MFCTQSVIRGLTRLFVLHSPFRIKAQTHAVFVPQPSVYVFVFLSEQKSDFYSILINILYVNVCGLLHSRSYGKNRGHAPFMVLLRHCFVYNNSRWMQRFFTVVMDFKLNLKIHLISNEFK
jgi:hypothetical protein